VGTKVGIIIYTKGALTTRIKALYKELYYYVIS